MRKLSILVLALVLVMGMSVMGYATTINNLDEPSNATLDVDLKVETYAELTIDESEKLSLTMDRPTTTSDMGLPTYTDNSVPFTLETNGDVNVILEETLSVNVGVKLKENGYSKNLVWANNTAWESHQINNWIVGFEAWVDNTTPTWATGVTKSNRPNYKGIITTTSFGQGQHNSNINVRGSWRFDGSNDDWWKLTSDDYTGEVRVTVASQ